MTDYKTEMKDYKDIIDIENVIKLLIKSKDINPQHKGAVLQHFNYENKYIISFCVEDFDKYPSFVISDEK